MKYLFSIFISLLSSFFAGWFLLDYLTVHPLKMSVYLIISLLMIVLLFQSILQIQNKAKRRIILGVSLLLFISGYLINASLFLNQEDYRFVPEITRTNKLTEDGHKAIVYFTHGEPETYNPIGWINQFKELDKHEIKFVPFVARPFFIFSLRNKYLEVGTSNHRKTHKEMLHSLEKLYHAEGDSSIQFYISFLDDEPRPDAAVIEALNNGADTIIVASIFLTISNHTAEGQEMIHELDIENKFKVDLAFTDPMWDSKLLKESFLEKAELHIGDTPLDQIAIAFIGHGQPDEWDEEWPTETNQEIEFRADIIDLFVEKGFDRENMGMAWMEFKEPKPIELMEKFVQNGVKKVFYFPTAISADAMHSQIDIPRLVMEYDFPKDIEIKNLGAWNNHPTVIKSFKEKIDKKLISMRE